MVETIALEQYDEKKMTAGVLTTDNFLCSGYETDRHRHCKFLEGYIEGVVDQSFKEWSRWTNKVFDYKVAHLGCRLTKEIDKNARCIFSLTFSPEKLVESGGDLVEDILNDLPGNLA